jgi:hypothetical protein
MPERSPPNEELEEQPQHSRNCHSNEDNEITPAGGFAHVGVDGTQGNAEPAVE